MDPVLFAFLSLIMCTTFLKMVEHMLLKTQTPEITYTYDNRWENPTYVAMIHRTRAVENELYGEYRTDCLCASCTRTPALPEPMALQPAFKIFVFNGMRFRIPTHMLSDNYIWDARWNERTGAADFLFHFQDDRSFRLSVLPEYEAVPAMQVSHQKPVSYLRPKRAEYCESCDIVVDHYLDAVVINKCLTCRQEEEIVKHRERYVKQSMKYNHYNHHPRIPTTKVGK